MVISPIDLGVIILGVAAVACVGLAYWLPHRLRPADVSEPADREAYRSNFIQALTLLLVVLGVIVGLKQLGTSLEELQDARSERLAGEIDEAEQRLLAVESTEQVRHDAVAELAELHAESSENRVRVERILQRFVQDNAASSDYLLSSDQRVIRADVAAALHFLVTDGQAQTEPEWRFSEGGARLNLASLDLRGFDLQGARLTNANLRGSFLQEADLRQAQLHGADLTGADLSGANLQQAVLSESLFANATLTATRLTGADLAGSDLRGANGLTWEQIRDAAIGCTTQLPTTLQPSSRASTQPLPMILVLRDCLQPTELRIVADRATTVLFGTVLRDPVSISIPDLGINIGVLGAVQVEGRGIRASEGTYAIVAAAEAGAAPLRGTLHVSDATLGNLEADPMRTPATNATPVAGNGGGRKRPTLSLPDNEDEDIWFDDPLFEGTVIASISDDPWLDEPPPDIAVDETSTPTGEAILDISTLPDMDCVDFASQEQAQQFFEAAGGPEIDLFGLDGDGDGIACTMSAP